MTWEDPLQNYNQEEVILLGESHTEPAHNELEEEVIYRTIPRTVLSEGLDQDDPSDNEELLERINLMNLEDVNEFFEINFEDSRFLAEDSRELFKKASTEDYRNDFCDGKIPETYNEFMNMPFSRMDPGIIDLITGSITDRQDSELEELLQWKSKGSENIKDNKVESLRKLRADIRSRYDLPDSMMSLANPISNLRNEGYEINLAGCDVDKKDRYSDLTGYELSDIEKQDLYDADADDSLIEFIEKMNAASQLTDDQELRHRDEVMAERISEFYERNDSDQPILAVIGSKHLDGVTQNLERTGIDVYNRDLSEIVDNTDFYDSGVYAMNIADSCV